MRGFSLKLFLFLVTFFLTNLSLAQNGENIRHVKWLYSFWDNPQQVELQGDYAYNLVVDLQKVAPLILVK